MSSNIQIFTGSNAVKSGTAVSGSELLVQALLHERRGERGEAAHYFRMNLQRIDEQGNAGQDAVEALQFLGQYSLVRPFVSVTKSADLDINGATAP